MNANNVDMLHYMGFQSYGVKPVATSKPGIKDYYIKNAYQDISNYNKRRVNYFDDKTRWSSLYNEDYLKTISDKSYATARKTNIKLDLDKYEHAQEPNVIEMITDGRKRNEELTRSRFAQSTDSFNRKKMFSNWETEYDGTNKKTEEQKAAMSYQKSEIDDLFKNKYHNYHHGFYNTEHTHSIGVHGDIPFQKFFDTSQPKLYSDNYDIALGTTKPTKFIPGYSGYIPVNNAEVKNTLANDPYFGINKTNHLLNYKVRLPNYSGFLPQNPKNLKGNTRPYCLSTKDETFS